MILSKAIDIAGQDGLGRRYLRDGKGLCVKAAITPCDTTEECCEQGIQCVIEDREMFDARVAETTQLFSAMNTAMQSCQTVFQAWVQGATHCQQIGTLTARTAWKTYATKERLFSWPPAGCQEFWEKDQELDVQLSAVFQLAARFVTWMQDTRSHVSYLEFPVQIPAGQIAAPADPTVDDGKLQATQVAATAQVQSSAPSSHKSRAEK